MKVLDYARLGLALLGWLTPPTIIAQVAIEKPVPVKNINTTLVRGDTPPAPLAVLHGRLIFSGFSPGSGWEPWSTDGSPDGACRIQDIRDGPASALDPSYLPVAVTGEKLLFPADDGVHGVELWASDGTEPGARLVKDLRDGPGNSTPRGFATTGGVTYFTADTDQGSALWTSDGSTVGTKLVEQLPSNAEVSSLVSLGSSVHFLVRAGDDGGLWRSDGSPTGTQALLNGKPGVALTSLVRVGARLLFVTTDNSKPQVATLWKSDGTTNGTSELGDFPVSNLPSGPRYLFTAKGSLFFADSNALWMSDGTDAGTVRVAAMRAGITPDNVLEVDGITFFTILTGKSTSVLWRTDGTPEGTIELRTFHVVGFLPSVLGGANGIYYFRGSDDDGAQGEEPWRSDGTPAGTYLLNDLVPGPVPSAPGLGLRIGDGFFFFAIDETGKRALWKSDGTSEGTTKVSVTATLGDEIAEFTYDAAPLAFDRGVFWSTSSTNRVVLESISASSGETQRLGEFGYEPSDDLPSKWTNALGLVFFAAPKPGQGTELWRTDGTVTGTFRIRRAYPRDQGSIPNHLIDRNGTLVFLANGYELWRSDGTESGTSRIDNFEENPARPIYSLINANGSAFFVRDRIGSVESDDAEPPSELWKTDGSERGTVRVAGLTSHPTAFAPFLDRLVFTMPERELWETDGTKAGTRLLKRMAPDRQTLLESATVVGTNLFFLGGGTAGGTELWRTDGTESGTTVVEALMAQLTSSGAAPSLGSLVDVEGNLFLTAWYSQAQRSELWKVRGGTLAASPVKNFPASIAPIECISLGGALLFVQEDPQLGWEIWRSDGTEAGTYPLTNLRPGDLSAYPFALTRVANSVFFWVVSESHSSLWKTDGSAAGTLLVSDEAPLPNWTEITGSPVAADDVLYFFGRTEIADQPTLWRTDGTRAGTFAFPNPGGIPLKFYGGMAAYSRLQSSGGTVFFAADDGVTGIELWRVGERDADHDGLPDAWERRFFGGEARPDADPDHDGLTNLEEARAGTDPTRPESNVRIGGLRRNVDGKIELHWPSVSLQEFTLLRSSRVSDLVDDANVIEHRIRATPPENTFVDDSATEPGPYFYRLRIEP